MARSLLPRLFGLGLATATLAASGTVWLTRSESPQDAALDVDNGIRDELFRYARDHPDWDGVAPLVRDLADRTGRRIALTGPDGRPIADSARDADDLPPAPTTIIDASSIPATLVPSTTSARATSGDVGFAYRGWRFSAAEQQQRAPLVDSATQCLRERAAEVSAEPRQLQAAGFFGGGLPEVTRPCVPAGLLAPSEANRSLNDEAVAAMHACLDQRGLGYAVSVDERGLPWVRPTAEAPRNADWGTCEQGARITALRDEVAPAADLYLGTDTGPPALVGWRTAVTVAGFLLASIAGAVLIQRQLTGVERLRGRRAQDLGHELRRPLTTVRGYLEAAEVGLVPIDKSFVRSLHEEALLLERLVADVTELGSPGAVAAPETRPTDHDAAELARQVVALHQGANVTLRLEASGGPVPVSADPARLRQALGNVVTNAVRHTPSGGSVTVSVHPHEDHVVMTVVDTGCGIAAEHLPYVFDRFYRVDTTGGTTKDPGGGLGLAIARELVEAQGGSIDVTSVVGTGTTVTIRLPRPTPGRRS